MSRVAANHRYIAWAKWHLVVGGLVLLNLATGCMRASSRSDAYVVAQKSDLRNLATAQESYFADHGSFASSLTALGSGFAPSSGIQIEITATPSGWRATSHHSGTDKSCTIEVGGNSSPEPSCR